MFHKHRLLFFILILPWFMRAQIAQKVQMLSTELAQIKQALAQPLPDQESINRIENQLSAAKAKVRLLENALQISPERTNPFLPGAIQDTKNKIEDLNSKISVQKNSLLSTQTTKNNPIIPLQLIDEWNAYKIKSFDYLTPLATKQQHQQQNQKMLADWYKKTLQTVKASLKDLQNSLFDFTRSFQQDCDEEFDQIRTILKIPPAVPKRTSSLTKEQAPITPISIEKETPIPLPASEKRFLEKGEKYIQIIKEKAEQAKKYAHEHASLIEKKLRKLIGQEEITTPQPTTPTIFAPATVSTLAQSDKINKLVHLIDHSKSTYSRLAFYTMNFNMLYTLLAFLNFPHIDPFDSTIFNLKKMADTILIMLDKTIEQLIKKQHQIVQDNQAEGDLYYTLFVLPTLLYTALINKQLASLSDQAADFYTKNESRLKMHYAKKQRSSLLPNKQEQQKFLDVAIQLLKSKNILTPADQMEIYLLLRSITVITGQEDILIKKMRSLLSRSSLKFVLTTKDNILSFINISLYKDLQSPFPIKKELLNDLFVHFFAFKDMTPLFLLDRTQAHTFLLWSSADYQQIDQAIIKINNTFEAVAKKAKERAAKEKNLTPTKLLHEQIEQILTLIKSQKIKIIG